MHVWIMYVPLLLAPNGTVRGRFQRRLHLLLEPLNCELLFSKWHFENVLTLCFELSSF